MARNPYPQGGLATPPPELDDDEGRPPGAGPAVDEQDQGDAGDDSADDAPARSSTRRSKPGGASTRAVSLAGDGAGWVLGLLLWGWVAVPFVKGGPAQVKKVWMAKFLNKAPDGSWLP